MAVPHTPVLLERVLEWLRIRPDGTYIDATLGAGGHSAAIAERLTSGRLISLDQDVRSEERRVGKECRSRWSPYH